MKELVFNSNQILIEVNRQKNHRNNRNTDPFFSSSFSGNSFNSPLTLISQQLGVNKSLFNETILVLCIEIILNFVSRSLYRDSKEIETSPLFGNKVIVPTKRASNCCVISGHTSHRVVVYIV